MEAIRWWRTRGDGLRGEGLGKLLERGDGETLNPQPTVAQLAILDDEQLKIGHDSQAQTDVVLSRRSDNLVEESLG